MPVAVAAVQSPAGMVAAGEVGAGVLTMSVPRGQHAAALAGFWGIAEETAERHGHTMDRNEWRVVLRVHLAETREEALRQIRHRGGRYQIEYSEGTTGSAAPSGLSVDEAAEYFVKRGDWCVGTPDDLIAKIEELQGYSGGFGGLMVQTIDWCDEAELHHSFELLARYVMPHFQGSIIGLEASRHDASQITAQLREVRERSLQRARDDYAAAKGDS
jgi:limonene 1,2-monooxygenase